MTVIAAGSIKKRLGVSYIAITWVGWAILALGCGLLAILSPSTSIPAWIFIGIPSGLGVGFLFPGLMYSILAPQAAETRSTALALNPFLRALGQAFGIAIGNAIYQNAFKAYLLDARSPLLQLGAAELAQNSAKLGAVLHDSTDGSAAQEELLSLFNKSLRVLWFALMGISILAFLLSLGIAYRKHSLGTPLPKREPTTTPNSEPAVHRDSHEEEGLEMTSFRDEMPPRNHFATPTNPFTTPEPESRLSNCTT